MKTISRADAALGGFEYRITRGGLNDIVYNICERSPTSSRFKVIATLDCNTDDNKLIVPITEADLSGDPARYLRAAKIINAEKGTTAR